jgi:hypothetical protein
MQNKMNGLCQCFSTFLASSPGSRKKFELLSRSKFFAMIMSQYYSLFPPKGFWGDLGFAKIISQHLSISH